MADLKNLRAKSVILKMAGASRAIPTSVVSEEEEGLWFSSNELFGELRGIHASIPQSMKNAAVFVPFSQMLFLITENVTENV